MNTSKKARIYSIIGAVCFTVYALSSIFQLFIDEYRFLTSTDELWWAFLIGMAILLFVGKKNIGFIIVTGFGLGVQLYPLIEYQLYYNIMFCVKPLAYGLLFVLFLVNVVPPLSKKISMTRSLYYIPAVVYMVGYLTVAMPRGEYFIFPAINAAGMLFAGLWLKADRQKVEQSVVRQNHYSSYNRQALVNQNSHKADNTEELNNYKNLLDSGVITQEEYDTKIKQLQGKVH